jgi:hypothetical protein
MSNLFINQVLLPDQQRVWPSLSLFKDTFYLAGGTGLAIQIGHRVSNDFDLFSQTKIAPQLRQQVLDKFPDSRFTLDSTDQLTWITPAGVKITLAYTPNRPLYSLVTSDVVNLESIADIAADMAFTIGRRGQFREYVDIAAILKSGYQLTKFIKDAITKYSSMFDEKLFLEQLTYLTDLNDRDVLLIDQSLTKSQIAPLLTEVTRQYVAAITDAHQ